MSGNQTCGDDLAIIQICLYTCVFTLCFTLETNIMLYINDTSIKKVNNQRTKILFPLEHTYGMPQMTTILIFMLLE